ncbi:MAG: SAM-dependent methyltransferase [Candidatus Binataceae bacterium]
MSGFDADWLARREPFDIAARDVGLAQQFGAALGNARRPWRIVDLAAGTGASFRALAPHLAGDQDWLMVDHDPLLIAAQAEALSRWAQQRGWQCRGIDGGIEIDNGRARWRAQALRLDLARELDALDFAACDGVTTTAFLDLVSAAWLDKLCGLLARNRVPLFAALTVDGRRVWNPPLAADAHINNAFGRHQGRDKGFGPALGPCAAAYLADRLAREGYDVATARSDWRIGHSHRDMLLAMIEETAAVACEDERLEAARYADWAEKRRAQIQCGLSLTVGHLDLVGRPCPRAPAT